MIWDEDGWNLWRDFFGGYALAKEIAHSHPCGRFQWMCPFFVEWVWNQIHYLSGQIIIFHQPRFPWNKGFSLPQLPFRVRSFEVAIIWPDLYQKFTEIMPSSAVFLGFSPFPVTVTTRIITFLVGDPNLNLHLPLLLGGGTTQSISSIHGSHFVACLLPNCPGPKLPPEMVMKPRGLASIFGRENRL